MGTLVGARARGAAAPEWPESVSGRIMPERTRGPARSTRAAFRPAARPPRVPDGKNPPRINNGDLDPLDCARSRTERDRGQATPAEADAPADSRDA
jgi:hypothetical protein